MNGRDVIRRLEAYAAGAPRAVNDTLHVPVADADSLLRLAFVRMGGESLPWGVAFGYLGEPATVLTVTEARDRDAVAQMVASFAPTLLAHLHHPASAGAGPSSEDDPSHMALEQIWLPNAAHIEMLHHLNLRYTFARQGEPERIGALNALGRAAGWAFRESSREGQVAIIDATQALRQAYSFPADDLRQQHLGFLLAWLRTRGSRVARELAAETAEGMSVSITLDPALERDELEPRLEAARDGNVQAANEVKEILEAELLRRIDLVDAAIDALKSDPRVTNPGTATLATESARSLLDDYLRTEERLVDDPGAFVPSPETDHAPQAAAAGFLRNAASAEVFGGALVHDDPALQAEWIAAGDGLRGTIVAVEDRSPTRATVPVWTIETSSAGPTRLRRGSGVCVAGAAGRSGRVLAVTEPVPGTRRVEVEIREWKRARTVPLLPAATDQALVGTTITLVSGSVSLSDRKCFGVWRKDGPGAWLTHGAGGAPAPAAAGGADVLAEVKGLAS